MPLNLIVSYLLSILGIKYIYKNLDQKTQISLGLFIGSLIALLTLIIYFLSGMDQIYIPIIIGALILIFEYYSTQNNESISGSELDQYIQTETIPKSENKVSIILEDDETYSKQATDINTNPQEKVSNENKKLDIDDLIK